MTHCCKTHYFQFILYKNKICIFPFKFSFITFFFFLIFLLFQLRAVAMLMHSFYSFSFFVLFLTHNFPKWKAILGLLSFDVHYLDLTDQDVSEFFFLI
uniref:Uncharacterized protein n=1 Tax=Octopus bimaculoides TaxID=37653 RepID=A0A0L8I0G2_OCTBM